jgi:hypothetical protein
MSGLTVIRQEYRFSDSNWVKCLNPINDVYDYGSEQKQDNEGNDPSPPCRQLVIISISECRLIEQTHDQNCSPSWSVGRRFVGERIVRYSSVTQGYTFWSGVVFWGAFTPDRCLEEALRRPAIRIRANPEQHHQSPPQPDRRLEDLIALRKLSTLSSEENS